MEGSERAGMPAPRTLTYRFKGLRKQRSQAGSYERKAKPPAENNCQRRSALYLAYTGEPDGGENQSPNQKHVNRRGQTVKKWGIRRVHEVSRIRCDRILKRKRVWTSATQQRQDCQRNAQESRQAGVHHNRQRHLELDIRARKVANCTAAMMTKMIN